MMRQMRENTKLIMLVTAAAFVGLMVFEWGMDATGMAGGGGEVGSVGGTAVSAEEFQRVRNNLHQQLQEQYDDFGAIDDREVDNMAWDEVVNRILIEQELERRGIEVTEDEIRQAAQFSPPPDIQADPQFQTEEGQFDLQAWQQFLASPQVDQRFLMQLEDFYREVIPRNKLVRQLTAGVYVPEGRLWREWREEHEMVEARFVSLDPDERVADAEVEVTDEEVEAYYQENRADFRVPTRLSVRYVAMDKTPTAADSAAARDRADELHARLTEDEEEDFQELAREESDDEVSAEEGGDLGTVSRGELADPLAEFAFEAPVGQVSEPIRTARGYHILQVTDRDEEAQEVEARQILVAIQRTEDSEIDLLMQADSLEQVGENLTLDEAAAEFGLEVREREIHDDLPYLPGVGRAGDGVDWAFNEMQELGRPSPLFETPAAFYMLEVQGWSEAAHLSLEDARPEVERRLRAEKKMERVWEEAQEIHQEIRDGASLDEVAERHGLEILEPEPFTRTTLVPHLGLQNAAVGMAFGTDPGQVAEPVRTDDNVVILEVVDRIDPDREDWEAQLELQRMQAMQQEQQQRLEEWLEGLREVADIQDRRSAFFREAEEEPQQDPGFPVAF